METTNQARRLIDLLRVPLLIVGLAAPLMVISAMAEGIAGRTTRLAIRPGWFLAATIVFLGIVAISGFFQLRAQRRELLRVLQGTERLQELMPPILVKRITATVGDAGPLWRALLAEAHDPPSGTGEPGSDAPELEDLVTDFRQRLDRIEQGQPSQGGQDQDDAVERAVLSTRLDGLEKSLERLEAKMPTRWEITITVFAILAALASLVGAVLGIVAYFDK